MNKKVLVILLVALLLTASTVLAVEENIDTPDHHGITELQQPESHTTLCGEGNGPGNPG